MATPAQRIRSHTIAKTVHDETVKFIRESVLRSYPGFHRYFEKFPAAELDRLARFHCLIFGKHRKSELVSLLAEFYETAYRIPCSNNKP